MWLVPRAPALVVEEEEGTALAVEGGVSARQMSRAPAQEGLPGCINFPPEPENTLAKLRGGVQGGGRANDETRNGSNTQHKAGLLSWLVASAGRQGGLIGGERTSPSLKPLMSLLGEGGS